MALPSEIGLYFDFEVTDDGIPYGCPGLEKFNTGNFSISKLYFVKNFMDPLEVVKKLELSFLAVVFELNRTI